MQQNDIVYYTCYFGGEFNYSKLIPPLPSEKYDCYYFTNNKDIFEKLANTKFIRIFVTDVPIYDDHVLDSMASKFIRCLPHKIDLLKKYKYWCWFDSKLQVFSESVDQMIYKRSSGAFLKRKNGIFSESLAEENKVSTEENKQIKEEITIAFSLHESSHSSVWDEYNSCINVDKYNSEKDKYKKYIEDKILEGYSDNTENFCCSSFSIRKNIPIVHQFNELWYNEILECGIECQISLHFLMQTYASFIKILPNKYCWKYFYE